MSGSDHLNLQNGTLDEKRFDSTVPVSNETVRIGDPGFCGDCSAFLTACGTPNTSMLALAEDKSVQPVFSPTPSFGRTIHQSSDSSDSELAFNLNDTIDHNSFRHPAEHHFFSSIGLLFIQ